MTGVITVTFPNVTGVDDPQNTRYEMAGDFGSEETAFDGIENTFAEGTEFTLSDYELQPSTNYTLTIKSIKVNNVELVVDTTYTLNFKTRSAERKMEWTFTIDAESAAQIVAEGVQVK